MPFGPTANLSSAPHPIAAPLSRTPPPRQLRPPFHPDAPQTPPSNQRPSARPSHRPPALQVWPNPFNATTHLGFRLDQAAGVHIAIYNIQGQRVRTLVDAPLYAGLHQMRWNGRDERGHSVATGPYFIRFHSEHTPPHYTKFLLLR